MAITYKASAVVQDKRDRHLAATSSIPRMIAKRKYEQRPEDKRGEQGPRRPGDLRDDKRPDDRPDDRPPDEPKEPRPDLPVPGFSRRERERYTPFIVLQYAAGDTGARPLVPGTTFWHSPDVWVVSSAGVNQPVAGEPNLVFARVNNWGMQDASVAFVRWWWANPSLAITEPNAHRIDDPNSPTTVFVPAGSSVVVQCKQPWTPVIENNGHECLFAEAWVPFLDDLTAPLEPVSDRHVGQKNLHVIEVEPGTTFSFSLQVANISTLSQRALVTMNALSFPQVRRALSAQDIAFKGSLRQTRQALALDLAFSNERLFLAAHSTIYARRLLASAEQTIGSDETQTCVPIGAVQQALQLDAGEARELTLSGTVPRSAQPGEVFGFQFTQLLGNLVMGGYTLYVVVSAPA